MAVPAGLRRKTIGARTHHDGGGGYICHMKITRALRRGTVVAIAAASLACGKEPPSESQGFHGILIAPPQPKPDFTFTSASGAPYDLRKETDGKVTLLFFGYTHCPDVCPLHMANIAAVMKKMSIEDRARIRVLFVTTDPERDTPDRLTSWLASFDPSFVGLAGPMDQVNQLQRSMGFAPAFPEPAPEGSPAGSYGVAHSAVVLAFTPDDSLRVIYPFGTRQQDWAQDLPALIGYTSR
jgi:protein SCO1